MIAVWYLVWTLSYRPLTRYVNLRLAHAPGIPGTFSPPPWVSDPDMHHGTCVTHVPWCMPGSITSGFLWSRWRGKRSRHSRRMCNPQFYVSGERPMRYSLTGDSFEISRVTYDWWSPLTKGQYYGKCFHVMALSCVSCVLFVARWALTSATPALMQAYWISGSHSRNHQILTGSYSWEIPATNDVKSMTLCKTAVTPVR